ncbi:hypothetical protein cand_011760 [Cryptosporidium andersoni]|uniref:Uncharacterized protein n=1 Tax=Cryptosporidium andersoni TaxID=117008 RepID=A0A1J4MEI6_9CRYT|nr:hypothetical protein cand_011760 [Cryptosporidium andersoni]
MKPTPEIESLLPLPPGSKSLVLYPKELLLDEPPIGWYSLSKDKTLKTIKYIKDYKTNEVILNDEDPLAGIIHFFSESNNELVRNSLVGFIICPISRVSTPKCIFEEDNYDGSVKWKRLGISNSGPRSNNLVEWKVIQQDEANDIITGLRHEEYRIELKSISVLITYVFESPQNIINQRTLYIAVSARLNANYVPKIFRLRDPTQLRDKAKNIVFVGFEEFPNNEESKVNKCVTSVCNIDQRTIVEIYSFLYLNSHIKCKLD